MHNEEVSSLDCRWDVYMLDNADRPYAKADHFLMPLPCEVLSDLPTPASNVKPPGLGKGAEDVEKVGPDVTDI